MVWAVVIQERSGKDLTDYQVRVEVTDSQFFSECTEQRFVEFYDSDKTTLLSHYTEIFDVANNKAVFWVKVPSIPANSTKMIYLNVNTERTEDLSNPEAVFDFFDDFKSSELDTAKWVDTGTGDVILDSSGDGYVSVGNTGNVAGSKDPALLSAVTFQREYILEANFQPTGAEWVGFYWQYADYNNLYRLLLRNSDDTYLFGKYEGGAKTNWATWVALGFDTAGWHELTIKSSLNGQEVYVDGNLIDSNSDAELNGNNKIGFSSYDTDYLKLDWVRVRKYAEQEPSVTVAKAGATATLDFKRIVAKALAGKIANILNGDPKLKLYSGGSLIKEITAGARLRKEDTANKRFIVMFLFVDDSSDAYTTDSQELVFPHSDGDYVAFTQSESFEKVADEPLPLRWEIYIPWVAEDFGWG